MNFRTDLASELRDEMMKNYAEDNRGLPDGITETKKTLEHGVTFCEINITTDEAAALIGKPIGRYITLSFASSEFDYASAVALIDAAKNALLSLIDSHGANPQSVMFCGLGNRLLSADSIGPLAADGIIATHHIKKTSPEIYSKSNLFDMTSVAPGVTAQTGIEAFDTIKSIVSFQKPQLLIVCDALAAREVSRLSRTIQLSSCGISPGSGVGGGHAEISENTIGIPVISIGVPTVVDTQTLIFDALSPVCSDEKLIESASDGFRGMFVCPNDIDVVSKRLASVICCAVNSAFQKDFSYQELLLL